MNLKKKQKNTILLIITPIIDPILKEGAKIAAI